MSFRAKLIMGVFFINIALFWGIAMWRYANSKQEQREKFASNAESVAGWIAESVEDHLSPQKLEGLREKLRGILVKNKLAYIRIVKTGQDRVWVEVGNQPQFLTSSGTVSELKTYQDTYQVLDVFAQIGSDAAPLGELQVGVSFSGLEETLKNLRNSQVRVLIVQAVLTVVFLFLLGWYLSRRIGLLMRACNEMAAGNLDAHIDTKGKDEIARLSMAFKEMAQSLKAKQIEADLRRQELVSASRMSSLGEMASGIAHEVNNPLAIIAGYSSQLRDRASKGTIEPPEMIEKLGKIHSTVMRISKIIKSLRVVSRQGDVDPFECVPVAAIIEDTLELCRERFRQSSVEIQLDVPPTLQLECRPTQLVQVILNLLNNSFDSIQKLESRWVRVEAYQRDQSVEIAVVDSGAGIPPEVAEKIMQPFFTTKEVGKGTGLGLSISHGIIKSHGGRFELDQKSKNTRFVISIPVRQNIQNQNAA